MYTCMIVFTCICIYESVTIYTRACKYISIYRRRVRIPSVFLATPRAGARQEHFWEPRARDSRAVALPALPCALARCAAPSLLGLRPSIVWRRWRPGLCSAARRAAYCWHALCGLPSSCAPASPRRQRHAGGGHGPRGRRDFYIILWARLPLWLNVERQGFVETAARHRLIL